MKKNIPSFIFASLLSLALCADAKSVRDPFWPVGYEPPPPPGQDNPEPEIQKPSEPKPLPIKPITSEEWKMARKLLKVNGYASAEKQDGGATQKTSVVIVNLKHYKTGDTIKITTDNINFIWTVGPIGENSVELIQSSATRTGPDQSPPHQAEIRSTPTGILN
jgi:hypothetical protein